MANRNRLAAQIKRYYMSKKDGLLLSSTLWAYVTAW